MTRSKNCVGLLCWLYAAFLIALLLASWWATGTLAFQGVVDAGVPSPPATFYGEVQAGPGFIPTTGMSVTAWIDGQACGQSFTMVQEGSVVYAVDVVGDGPGGSEGCGSAGRTVVFEIGAQYVAPTAPWDSSQMHYLALQPMRAPMNPEVSIQSNGDALVLSWQAVTHDVAGQATLVTSYRVWRGRPPYFDPALPDCDCVNIATVTGLTYTDTDDDGANVIGDVNANYTYVVKAFNAIGESADSIRVGEFDFALTPGVSTAVAPPE